MISACTLTAGIILVVAAFRIVKKYVIAPIRQAILRCFRRPPPERRRAERSGWKAPAHCRWSYVCGHVPAPPLRPADDAFKHALVRLVCASADSKTQEAYAMANGDVASYGSSAEKRIDELYNSGVVRRDDMR